MPNLLAWMAHPKTGEFGAQVQLNDRGMFTPKPDGSLDVWMLRKQNFLMQRIFSRWQKWRARSLGLFGRNII
jgi:hypothetical protein